MTFVDLSDDHSWVLKKLDANSKEVTEIIPTIKNKQYYTWAPNGILLMGDGKRLYKFDPQVDKEWVELANLTDYGIKDFTRLTVSPKGDLLAVVVSE